VIVQQRLPPVRPVEPVKQLFKPVKLAVPQPANAVAAVRNAQGAGVPKVPAADDKVAQAVVATVAAVTVDMAVAAKVAADGGGVPEQVVHAQPKRSWLPAKSPRLRSLKR
jgi:hypothetical protein